MSGSRFLWGFGGWLALMLVATSVELVKVRCRELGAVDWTEEEVRKRGGRVVHVIGLTTRPGQRGDTLLGTEAGDVRLEAEPNASRNGEAVDLRFNYEAAVRHQDGVRVLTVNTGVAMFSGQTVYVGVVAPKGGWITTTTRAAC